MKGAQVYAAHCATCHGPNGNNIGTVNLALDVIEELDGKPVQGMRLADLQRAFVQDGRDRLLKVRRLGVERTTTLKMLAIR